MNIVTGYVNKYLYANQESKISSAPSQRAGEGSRPSVHECRRAARHDVAAGGEPEVNPATHLLAGWAVASTAALGRRDRAIVMLAGVVPDVDALGIVAEHAAWWPGRHQHWYSEYHHLLAHNLLFALLVVIAAAAASRRRAMTAFLAFASFHLHLLCDLAGSRGPDGHQWPIAYLAPFRSGWQLAWDGQWALNSWPNVAFTVILLAWTLYFAWKRGQSPVGLLSSRADAALVSALRERFGAPGAFRQDDD